VKENGGHRTSCTGVNQRTHTGGGKVKQTEKGVKPQRGIEGGVRCEGEGSRGQSSL